jgi:hypothetical protein
MLLSTIALGGLPAQSRAGSTSTAIGYRTVAQALAAVKQMKGVSVDTVRGWTIVTDEANLTVWSFAPRTDPSYPAVVRRTVTSTGTGSKVTLDVLCEAKKSACDNLRREFSNTKTAGAGAVPANR